MPDGPLGGPRPFADTQLVMDVSISIGAMDRIEEGKRDVTDREVAELEQGLRNTVIKSIGTGPADQKIDVRNKPAKGSLEIFLGDKVKMQQVSDIERVFEREGFKIADWTIQGE